MAGKNKNSSQSFLKRYLACWHACLKFGLLLFLVVSSGKASQNRIEYDLSLELFPKQNTLNGSETVTLTNLSIAPLETLYFHLAANTFRDPQAPTFQRYENVMSEPTWLQIHSVEQDNQSVKFLDANSPFLKVILPQPLLSGDSVRLSLRFSIYLPAGRHSLCPSRSNNLFRLIAFYPRLIFRTEIQNHNSVVQLPSYEYALYRVNCTVPAGYWVAGSLLPDSTVQLTPDQSKTYFQPEEAQEIAFIIHNNFRISRLRAKAIPHLDLLTAQNRSTRYDDKIVTQITNDILNYYQKYFSSPLQHLTVFQTVIPDGYAATNFILLEKDIFQGIAHLDYLSLHVLAREIARQYLGFESNNQAAILSIRHGFANYAATSYLTERYTYLRQKYKVPQNFVTTYTLKFMNLLLASLERENIFPSNTYTSKRANAAFISEQSQHFYSQRYVQMVHAIAGDSLFKEVLKEYRDWLKENYSSLERFNLFVEKHTGYHLAPIGDYYEKQKTGPDIAVHKIRLKALADGNQYQTSLIIRQKPALMLPLPVSVTDRNGNNYRYTVVTNGQKYDTVKFCLSAPLKKISLDPDKIIWDSNRFNNHYPRNLTFKFLAGLPQIDTYQIFYYPTFDFNQRDWTRLGLKLHSRYWINLQPFFPAQSLDEWSLGINYGYQSQTWGYDFSYGTSILALFFKPRLQLRWRDYFGLEEGRLASEVYLGDVRYPGLSRISGYQKLKIGAYYQYVRTLKFLNANSWQTGRELAPFFDFVNFHNWGNWRHVIQVQGKWGVPYWNGSYHFTRLSIDGQVKIRLSERNWYYQRIFLGSASGEILRQELFYFFGKNVLENLSFEAYRLARGEGDMRGYGMHKHKGSKILTSNTEWRLSLAGVDQATFDFLLFYDIGALPQQFDRLQMKDFRSDAGCGLEFDIFEAVLLGMHFPLWVSHPLNGESRWQWRWVIAFDFTL